MQIRKTRIRSAAHYLKRIGATPEFCVRVRAGDHVELLHELGFSKPLPTGETIVPAARGAISDFNANDKVVVHSELPKEQSSRLVYRTWKDWHGNSHSGMQVRRFETYPREFIQPPCEDLTISEDGGVLFVTSRTIGVDDEADDAVTHLINLFLELFGECELVTPSLEPITKVKKVQWEILPPGEHPWEKAEAAVKRVTSRLDEADRNVVEYRVKEIAKHAPDLVAVGTGGFDGYLVFGFRSKGVYVLESTHLDNATYVFRSDWESLSSLTKREILTANLQHARLVHNGQWGASIRSLFARLAPN
ncbi:hypothetical protein [Niveibacterium sp.]|uniref:hypothetical protein n=1 Tax=Niveibacterium sp. TaxID=2017444 RepID=UPI0035B30282